MATAVFSSADDIGAHITRHCCAQAIIGIDGWIGAGKTGLARALEKSAAGACLDLDCFLKGAKGSFLGAFDFHRFRASVLAPRTGRLFLSGVCLRQISAESGIQVSTHIYVKRMNSSGWADKDEAEGFSVGTSVTPELLREIRNYHRVWKPHSRAEIEYRRHEI